MACGMTHTRVGPPPSRWFALSEVLVSVSESGAHFYPICRIWKKMVDQTVFRKNISSPGNFKRILFLQTFQISNLTKQPFSKITLDQFFWSCYRSSAKIVNNTCLTGAKYATFNIWNILVQNNCIKVVKVILPIFSYFLVIPPIFSFMVE